MGGMVPFDCFPWGHKKKGKNIQKNQIYKTTAISSWRLYLSTLTIIKFKPKQNFHHIPCLLREKSCKENLHMFTILSISKSLLHFRNNTHPINHWVAIKVMFTKFPSIPTHAFLSQNHFAPQGQSFIGFFFKVTF